MHIHSVDKIIRQPSAEASAASYSLGSIAANDDSFRSNAATTSVPTESTQLHTGKRTSEGPDASIAAGYDSAYKSSGQAAHEQGNSERVQVSNAQGFEAPEASSEVRPRERNDIPDASAPASADVQTVLGRVPRAAKNHRDTNITNETSSEKVAQLATPPATQPTTKSTHPTVTSIDADAEPSRLRQNTSTEPHEPFIEGGNEVTSDNSELTQRVEEVSVSQQHSAQGRKRSRAAQPSTDENGGDGARSRKRKLPGDKEGKRKETRGVIFEVTDAVGQVDADTRAQPQPNKRRSRRRKREKTPDNAEQQKITPTKVTMSDLCAEPAQGKVSSRETRLRERDKELAQQRKETGQAKARKQAQDFMENPTGAAQPAQASGEQSENVPSRSPDNLPPPPSRRRAPMTQVVDGRIVQIDNSHIIDRHNLQENPGLAYDENASAVVEDDLTKRINSATYSKRVAPSRWTSELTELFYDGLRYFGMDFSLMTVLFPGRNRRQLKMKFIREQRADQNFINQVLKDRKPIPDVAELQERSGRVFRSAEDVYRELEKAKEQLMEAHRKDEQMAEEARKEREKEIEKEGAALGVGIAPRADSESTEGESESEDEQSEVIVDDSHLTDLKKATDEADEDAASTSLNGNAKKEARKDNNEKNMTEQVKDLGVQEQGEDEHSDSSLSEESDDEDSGRGDSDVETETYDGEYD